MATTMTRGVALPVALFMLAASGSIVADKANAAPPPADTKATHEKQTPATAEKEVPRWIRQLGNDQFKERERASRELRKLGKAALPALKKALKDEDAEIRSRAQILIAQIDPPPAPAPEKAPDEVFQVALVVQGGLQLQGQQLQVLLVPAKVQPVPGNAGGGQRTSRTVDITEGPQGIAMTITQTKNGKEIKKEYKAKNAAELEKKYPEAYKLYKGSAELLPDQAKPRK